MNYKQRIKKWKAQCFFCAKSQLFVNQLHFIVLNWKKTVAPFLIVFFFYITSKIRIFQNSKIVYIFFLCHYLLCHYAREIKTENGNLLWLTYFKKMRITLLLTFLFKNKNYNARHWLFPYYFDPSVVAYILRVKRIEGKYMNSHSSLYALLTEIG